MRISRRITLAAVAGVVALGGLTACSGGGGAANASQSKEDACKVVILDLNNFKSEMQGLASASTPEARKDAVTKMVSKFDEIQGKIGNEEVKKALGGLKTAFTQIGDAASTTPDPAKAQSLLKDLQTSVTGLETACPTLK